MFSTSSPCSSFSFALITNVTAFSFSQVGPWWIVHFKSLVSTLPPHSNIAVPFPLHLEFCSWWEKGLGSITTSLTAVFGELPGICPFAKHLRRSCITFSSLAALKGKRPNTNRFKFLDHVLSTWCSVAVGNKAVILRSCFFTLCPMQVVPSEWC